MFVSGVFVTFFFSFSFFERAKQVRIITTSNRSVLFAQFDRKEQCKFSNSVKKLSEISRLNFTVKDKGKQKRSLVASLVYALKRERECVKILVCGLKGNVCLLLL